jgi:hypothetical protein
MYGAVLRLLPTSLVVVLNEAQTRPYLYLIRGSKKRRTDSPSHVPHFTFCFQKAPEQRESVSGNEQLVQYVLYNNGKFHVIMIKAFIGLPVISFLLLITSMFR